MKNSGQAAAPRARRRFVAVPVAAAASLVLAVSAVQPAVAGRVLAAGNARADRAGSAVAAGQQTFTADIQKLLLKFAAQKLAGFAFSKLGLDNLLADPTMARLDELQTQIAEIRAQQKSIQDSLNTISGDIAGILLSVKETQLQDVTTKIDALYNYFYIPALTALTEYVRLDLDAGGKCDADPCLAAKIKYEGADGVGGLRQKFLNQFTSEGAASYGEELHNLIMPAPSGDSIMGAYGLFLARKSNGFLTADDSAKVRNYYNYWADFRALAMWMIAQWMSDEDPTTGFNIVLDQIDSWQKAEDAALPPLIPENTVIALPGNASERTASTANLPMWGFRNGQLGAFAAWDPYNNATGVPKIIRQMNSDPVAGYGFNDWAVPSRAELDALLARGPATKTGKEFLLSLDSRWPALLGPVLDTAPYIWTTQEAGNPSWVNSYAIPCQNFNGASFVTVKKLTGYVHTAVGPVTGSLSVFPAQYQNYNRPDPHIGVIQVALKPPATVQDVVKACEAILKDDIGKASTGNNPYAALLATRSTGTVEYLPYRP